MRVAFFSPMPPSKSGIADYSEALVRALGERCQLTVFDAATEHFNPADFDHVLYQLGNNPHHAFVYEQALRTPGVVVMHEANLHHLLAELTIRRGDWDAYMREVEYDAGPAALAYARRVRALEVGPDYDNVPMLRRVLAGSRAAVAHSRYVAERLQAAGFTGPTAVIPHGAWLAEHDGQAARSGLGLEPQTPLVGIFGHLKPYKRINESLRAFRRLLRVVPEARLILVGEPHPDFPLQDAIHALGLGGSVRVTGWTEIDAFNCYLAACDIVLNLRYPTVGETSGTLLRALGMGKAVIVSDVGAFSEYPDSVCLKVPVDAAEEDTIFEYLQVLVTRPDLRTTLGAGAREWVSRECSWDSVATRYLDFLRNGTCPPPKTPSVAAEPSATPVKAAALADWAQDRASREYIDIHARRLQRTLEITPPGTADAAVLEMGAYLQITPALRSTLGYGTVRGCYYGTAGRTETRRVVSASGEEFACEVDLFDAERDRFPYADQSFDTVLCCELLEHLPADPMHMMAEINRVLKPGGHLVLTTPNAASYRAIAAVLLGYHPGFFPAYIRPRGPGEDPEARHAREYTPREIRTLFENSGFDVLRLVTDEFGEEPRPEHMWVRRLLEQNGLPPEMRGDDILALGRRTGGVRERYPDWLYS